MAKDTICSRSRGSHHGSSSARPHWIAFQEGPIRHAERAPKHLFPRFRPAMTISTQSARLHKPCDHRCRYRTCATVLPGGMKWTASCWGKISRKLYVPLRNARECRLHPELIACGQNMAAKYIMAGFGCRPTGRHILAVGDADIQILRQSRLFESVDRDKRTEPIKESDLRK